MHTPKSKCCIYQSCLHNIIKGSYDTTQAKHENLRNVKNTDDVGLHLLINSNILTYEFRM